MENLQDIKSIFDFLYLDNTKIKSFYAQLTGAGSISSIKESYSITNNQNKEGSISVPPVATGKLAYSDINNKANERVYDAIPTMPREMINKLDELGFISRQLDESTSGKLVLLEGVLSITDIRLLKDMIEPAMKMNAYEESKHINNESQRRKIINKQVADNKVIVDVIKSIPYALEATLKTDNASVWMTLNRDEMVGDPHDINLKHGNFLHGRYYVLGVLDAVPEDSDVNFNEQNEIKAAMSYIVNILKIMFGRPSDSYGITPIAIFRVIK